MKKDRQAELSGSRCESLGPLNLGRTLGTDSQRSAHASSDQPNGRLVAHR
jgi:hypothetical protein